MSYPQVKLGDICKLQRGTTITKTQTIDGDIPVVAGGMNPTYYHNQANRTNDVITISASGANAGFVNFWQIPIFASDCTTIEINNDFTSIKYIYYFLKYKQEYIYSFRSGAAQPHVYGKDIAPLQIPLPPLAEQRRIAEILDKADSLIQKRKAAISKLDELLQATFIDMFGDPVTNPKGWNLSELQHFILNGPQNGLYKPASSYGQGTPIIRIDGFKNGDIIDQKEFKRLSIDDNDIEKYKLNKLDFVINRVNSPEYIGKTALIRNIQENTIFESNMMRFNVNVQKLNPYYLLFLLRQKFILNQIAAKRKDAVNQSSINQKDVMSLIIIIPLIELQDKWSEFAKAVEEQKQVMQAQLEMQETLFKSLQQQAFSGQL